MQVKKIDTSIIVQQRTEYRPTTFHDFIGQDDIVRVVKTAITSSKKSGHSLGHMLLLGPAGYGKTTLAQIISHELGTNCKLVTAYAISKPADIISLLNILQEGDVLFIDEIHRLNPKIEEMLYTAMEDFQIDMVMPDGGHVKIPVQPFTLIGATTKSDHLSKPLKSRFVYKFHFTEYTDTDKQKIIGYYLKKLSIDYEALDLARFARLLENVPRELYNGCVRLYDYLNSHNNATQLHSYNVTKHGSTEALKHGSTEALKLVDVDGFAAWSKSQDGGLTPLHQAYLDILIAAQRPLGLKTIAVKMGLDEKTVEEDIEPLLVKLGMVERGAKGRVRI